MQFTINILIQSLIKHFLWFAVCSRGKEGGRREVEQAFKLCARFLIETLRADPG